MKTIVFVHIPKTAGQAIHHELVRAVGAHNTSPIRVHTQVAKGAPHLPPEFLLHSGHIDWAEIDTLPAERFSFSVLRDPLERIASFYFYLLKEARGLTEAELATPQQTGKRMILAHSADDYFFGGDASWQAFVRDHNDNFYCSYFATRLMRGRRSLAGLSPDEILDRAEAGARSLSHIYHIDDLAALERDALAELGITLRVAGHYVNAGPHAQEDLRWPKLEALLQNPDSIARLRGYAELDRKLMARLGLPA